MIRRLHIGGKIAAEGWEIINAVRAPEVDHVGNANDLSQFADNTFAEMYASHVVEHLDYKKELARTLREWNRVLTPGGKIYISVPDLDVLARLFLDKEKLDFNQRYMVMRMIFGGHVDEYDYHVVGLNEDFLRAFLRETGYVNIQRVESFGLFADTSDMIYADVPISLNMTAQKPALSDEELRHAKVGRNDPCPCGSGKKFKKCHGQGA